MDKQTWSELGEFLRRRRRALGLTAFEVARRARIDRAVISRIESGFIRSPDPRKLARLADVLSIPVADLYGLVGYATPSQLPSFYPYLRTRYGELPLDAVRKLDRYFKSVLDEYGAGDSPIDREYEQPQ
jgi:transcriptional regulator with XRE-family HTH domain